MNMERGLGWFVLVALVATTFSLPAANAHHCETKINAYGRTAVAPVPPPPYTSLTAGFCFRTAGNAGVEDHLLPPNTDQVMVRILGDYGPSVPHVRVILDGLGFLGHEYQAIRVPNQNGYHSYDLPSWVPLPNGPTDGELTVTVIGPGGSTRSVEYHTMLTLVPPPPPTLG
jgi:hypothetical protein